MTLALDKSLLIGYGNPGRRDDGLGPALAAQVEALALPALAVDSDYQLSVEDAAELGRYRQVLLVDADAAGPAPYWVRRIEAADSKVSFSTHSVEPRALLALARDLFQAQPHCYLMGIRGYEFDEFGEGLSPRAQANLAAALEYVESAMERGDFTEVRPEGGERALARNIPTNEGDLCKTEST